MRHFILSCLLSFCLVACSFGQRKVDPAYDKLLRTISAVEYMYVDTINKEKLAEDAVIALLKQLDPHSAYLTAEEVQGKNEPLQGAFDGIGIQFNMLTDTLYVVAVIPGGPSQKVGLMAGDRIISVNDTIIAGVKMKNADVMSRLKGPKGSVVNVEVQRGSNPKLIPFRIERDKIPVHSVDAYYMIDDKTGYISLSRFALTSYDELMEAVENLTDQGMKNLILDLQNNGGGYLHIAAEIASEFLDRGSLITYTEGAHAKRDNYPATHRGSLNKGQRLVVLVNEASASASEILAGAIQDWDRGIIVGRRTFGKGLVQRPIPLGDGSEIHLTVSRYYTPSGRCIQKPYERGDSEAYNKELGERYNHGELMHADSIHFPDSLKFSTLKNKRIVYGGGGIMPDYFIPLDTARFPEAHRVLINTGVVNKYVMELVDKNRSTFNKQYKDFKSFRQNFEITDSMIQGIIDRYQKEREEEPSLPEYKDEDYTILFEPNSLIKMQVKSIVASNLWEENESHQISNELNEPLLKAIEIINDENWYNDLLNRK